MMMKSRWTILTMLSFLWSGPVPVDAKVVDHWVPFTQPDGTTIVAHVFGDEFEIDWVTDDGYAFVHNDADGYLYYAELDDRGDFRPSKAKVGIDDPRRSGITRYLQRSAALRAETQAKRVEAGYAKDTRPRAGKALYGDPAFAPCTGASPCDVYVVMVGFEDQASGGSVYADYDQPYGYSMALYNQFFNGGYDGVPAYTGTIAHTAPGKPTENLTVFGSVRAYFHQVHGEDILRFQILNQTDPGTGQPIWIPLAQPGDPDTKQWYATNSPARFWDAAEAAADANLTLPADFPRQTASAATQLANKVLYLYAGAVFTPKVSTPLALHPRVNYVTDATTPSSRIGARYVMGEREGFGWTDHDADRFAGIGTHVHEFGHLFGLVHPDGGWQGTNPHTGQAHAPPTVRFDGANLTGWGSMQNGAHGPPITANDYTIPHRAAPAAYNPFYRMDLGWNTRHDITATVLNQRIDPGPTHYYVVPGANGQSYILDFRTTSNFGQYTSWYQFTSAPGLLIWRRNPSQFSFNPMLIPADGRSISDARFQPVTANPGVQDWQDRLSDPFGAAPQPFGPTVTEASDATHLRHATANDYANNRGSNPDPGDSRVAFKNIRNNGDHALVDVYFNYWTGTLSGSPTWSGTVYVGGDVTVPAGMTLTINPGTVVRFTGNSDDQGTGNFASKAELIVYGTLNAQGVTFESADTYAWGGIVIEGDGIPRTTNSVLRNSTIRDAVYGTLVRATGWTAGGPAEADGNDYWSCTYGVFFDAIPHGGDLSGVSNSKIELAATGVYVEGASDITIDHNLIWNSSDYGVFVEGGSQDVVIDHNDVDHFGSNTATGIRFQGSSDGVVSNSNVTGAGCGSLRADGPSSVTASYFLWYPNKNSACGWEELVNVSPGLRRGISSAPRYKVAGSDHTLQASAPGLDLGDPGQSDVGRLDIGRYGATSSSGAATGELEKEDYFYQGQVSGWTQGSGTAGTWSGDGNQGTYVVSGVDGISRAYSHVDASSYTIEARLKFGGSEGKVLYHDADVGENYRVDLMASANNARLIVAGVPYSFTSVVPPLQSNKWYSVRVELANARIKVYLEGELIHDRPMPVTPDGAVGIGSYGGTHSAEFDYVVVMNGEGSGGGGYLVDDQFNDGSTAGWASGSGSWSESGGLFQVTNLNGEGWAYYTSNLGLSHYTLKVRLKFSSLEGKVVFRNAGVNPHRRIDLMSSDNVRIVSDAGLHHFDGMSINPNTWYDVEVEVDDPGNKISVWVNGTQAHNGRSMPGSAGIGSVGVGSYGRWHNTYFDYFQAYDGARSSKPVATRLEVPGVFRLGPNYPNPFNPSTSIQYEVPVAGIIRIEIFNILGQKVRTLVEGHHPVGSYQATWDGMDDTGRAVVGGVYLHRLSADGYLEARKMTLLR